MKIGTDRKIRHVAARCGWALVLLLAATAAGYARAVPAGASGPRPSSVRQGTERVPGETRTKPPVLLLREAADVNGDGVADAVSYYSNEAGGPLDAQLIEFGQQAHASVLALRCDFDNDGKDDDWMIVDPDTEEMKAALLDTDDNGEVDLVDLGNGGKEQFHGRGPHLPTGVTR